MSVETVIIYQTWGGKSGCLQIEFNRSPVRIGGRRMLECMIYNGKFGLDEGNESPRFDDFKTLSEKSNSSSAIVEPEGAPKSSE